MGRKTEAAAAATAAAATITKNDDNNHAQNADDALWWPHQHENNNECTLLVQVDDPTTDFTGATGAIGRIEVQHGNLILDLQGNKYQAKLLPGPTCWVVQPQGKDEHTWRIDGATDEFVRLSPMKNNNFQANIQGNFSQEYHVVDEDVNRKTKYDTSDATTNNANNVPPSKKARKNKTLRHK